MIADEGGPAGLELGRFLGRHVEVQIVDRRRDVGAGELRLVLSLGVRTDLAAISEAQHLVARQAAPGGNHVDEVAVGLVDDRLDDLSLGRRR